VIVGDCWLWREAARIRWWTPEATGFLASDHPHPHGLSLGWAEQRDGRSRAALQQALTSDLVEVLASALGRSESVRLRLAADLPESWARYPFEWLRHQGTPLQGRLLVERWVPKQAQAGHGLEGRDIVVLNLWPEEETVQPCGALDARADVYFGPAAVEHFMARADLSRLSLLAVVSHGSEVKEGPPFRLADGRAFELPLCHGLPPVVLMLACGTEDGNLLDYGRKLLAAGAWAVIAPVGQPDARAAEGFLRGFLEQWRRGHRLDHILREFHRQAEQERTGWRFCLLGRGGLRAGLPAQPEEWPDGRLAEAARSELEADAAGAALPALVERITLRCYQEAGRLEKVELELRAALEIATGDERREPALLRGLDRHHGGLSRLTQVWVLPLLGGLAEVYDHALLNKYDRLCRAMETALRAEGPIQSHHYLSKVPYRLGHYVPAARAAVDGLAKAGPNDPGRVRLLGQLFNLLIDLDLPDSGALVDTHLSLLLNDYRGEDAERQRMNRLDRQARLALRHGEPGLALARYAEKRRKAKQTGQDSQGVRELITLLYAASWAKPSDNTTRAYAEEARSLLPGPEHMLATLASDHPGGNDNAVYLIRALALWSWRAADRETAGCLARYSGYLRALLESERDPGPAGFSIWYLRLHTGMAPWSAELPSLNEAEAGLDSGSYWLELAALTALAGHLRKTETYLDRFQAVRGETVKILDGLPREWELDESWQSIASRADLEREVLLGVAAEPLPDRLIETGLLPL
jgi:hypothetical protein